MRREARPVGGYLPMDADGYVRNETSLEHLVPPWSHVVEAIIEGYVAEHGDELVGVFLRGSLPAGRAVPGLSDVDAFALIQPRGRDIRWQEVPWAGALAARMRAHHGLESGLDLHVATFDEHFAERNPRLQMVMKTQSLCVHGTDVIASIDRRYRPGPDMVLHVRWLRVDLDALYQVAATDASEDEVRQACRALMKVLLRSGFELVMAAEQRYTSSLYWCQRSFARHYPDRAEDMARALDLYLNPPGDVGAALLLARSLGEWLLEEAWARMPEIMRAAPAA